MLSVPIPGGQTAVINPQAITFMKPSGDDRTRVHFVSGEDLMVDRPIAQLAIDIA